MSKKSESHKNMTVWLDTKTITLFDHLAKMNRRSRNYIISRLLEGIAGLPPDEMKQFLIDSDCAEIKCQP